MQFARVLGRVLLGAAMIASQICLAVPPEQTAAPPAAGTQVPSMSDSHKLRKLAILDLELTGDLGGPRFAAEHEARLKNESDLLRQELERSGLYQVLDLAPAQKLIEQLRSHQAYLHDCNGCDLDVGRLLGADQVMVAWVDRVSGLILTLTYEIHEVSTSQIARRKSYDFRGDNDAAWTHAVRYMVRDLKRSMEGAEGASAQ